MTGSIRPNAACPDTCGQVSGLSDHPPDTLFELRLERLRVWLATRGLVPHPFQEETWRACWRGESGLVHVPTGAGKTWAAWFGPLAELAEEVAERPAPDHSTAQPGAKAPELRSHRREPGLRLLWVTPLRAVANDIERALADPASSIAPHLRVESRTGDTSQKLRRRQRERLPEVLVTTPESLSLLLTRDDAPTLLSGVRTVVLDEWHELVGSKRGTQVELALARLRAMAGNVRTWALSATLDDSSAAAEAAVGAGQPCCIIEARLERPLHLHTLVPPTLETFPRAGHLGLDMLPHVLDILDRDGSTIVFTNTRNQAEQWYHAILESRLEWAGEIGLHHGSLDREARAAVERGLADGSLRVVVATSSLDLGVDFAPVARVIQVGSIKGVARLLQRAGRAGHRPGAATELHCVTTNALQLCEVAAARRAITQRSLEPLAPLREPLDVLAQHMVTVAIGGGLDPDFLFDEVRTTAAYVDLDRERFDWVLRLVRDGGEVLGAYPDYRRLEEVDGLYRVTSASLVRRHRMNIGTIVSDAQVRVASRSGHRYGTVEESFIARLAPGDTFLFAGRVLRFEGLHEMTALVRPVVGKPESAPRWAGGRLPITSCLSRFLREVLADARAGRFPEPELQAARPLLEEQARLSSIPGADRTLAEHWPARDGAHLFLYPLEGILVHEGLGALLALRLGRFHPGTFGISTNDYGLELVAPAGWPFEDALRQPDLFSPAGLEEDAEQAVNVTELTRRQFREVARVAQLVFEGLPGRHRSLRQLQASAGLLHDVFRDHDPGNLLLAQARREVFETRFELPRLRATLDRLHAHGIELHHVSHPTPLGFPLLVERMRNRHSSEQLDARLARLIAEWTKPGTSAGRSARSRRTP